MAFFSRCGGQFLRSAISLFTRKGNAGVCIEAVPAPPVSDFRELGGGGGRGGVLGLKGFRSVIADMGGGTGLRIPNSETGEEPRLVPPALPV